MDSYLVLFKALADSNRLRLIRLLLETGGELCVCELVDTLGETQYNVSRQLRVLKDAEIVSDRKEGRWVYYRLANTDNLFVQNLLAAVKSIPDQLFAEDKNHLQKRLQLRVDNKCIKGISGPC